MPKLLAGDKKIEDVVGACLRVKRKSKKITLQQLGGIMGVCWQQLSKYEVGRNRISFCYFLKLCHAMDVDPMSMVAEINTIVGLCAEPEKPLDYFMVKSISIGMSKIRNPKAAHYFNKFLENL